MTLIVKVTARSERVSLGRLLTAPLGLDVWETHPDHLVLRAPDAEVERIERMGFAVEQLHETDSYVSTFAAPVTAEAAAPAVAGYHSAESMEADLRRLAEDHPDIAQLVEIGRSLENRPIWALRIGERRDSPTKALFLGCHHAREWISVEVPYLLAEDLLNRSGTNPVARWLQQGEIWVAPMVNPDGHEFTRTTDRLWRKNRRPNPGGSMGVDPNRNYGYMWGTLDVNTSSHVPSDETYVGPRAFSEPETRAVRDLMGVHRFRAVVTYHSYSQLILYPWGYTSDPIADPDDRSRMDQLGRRMQRAIRRVHNETYTVQQASRLYPTAGDTTDWTFGEYDVPSFTVELRPRSQAQGGFILPPSQIQPTFEENRPAAMEVLRTVFAA